MFNLGTQPNALRTLTCRHVLGHVTYSPVNINLKKITSLEINCKMFVSFAALCRDKGSNTPSCSLMGRSSTCPRKSIHSHQHYRHNRHHQRIDTIRGEIISQLASWSHCRHDKLFDGV